MVVWFTGLSSAGKSTLAAAVKNELLARSIEVELLDGDAFRKTLSRDLGFTVEDRSENVRRMGIIASVLASHGMVVLVAAVSPSRKSRADVRRMCNTFIEIYVNAPLDVCIARDVKGLYAKALRGEIQNMTGIDGQYEEPIEDYTECCTDRENLSECVLKVLNRIHENFSRSKLQGP